ncbi:MAG: dihydrofolate reductase [Candidatus Kerfeldbacteria bacterium]|nr:dihydrofolate reductase [Candidatus Kerfeldbacteria bacterium]
MKVILYMTTTLNGYIATATDGTPWSDESWASYAKKVQEVQNIVIGRRTYEVMKACNEFERIGHPFTVVVSSGEHEPNANCVFVHSPEEALDVLQAKGFSEVLVGGGGMLNAYFMQKGLIDEIYIDVEPLVFGKGIPLFAESDFDAHLELINTKQLSKNTVQLHYRVKKYN